jgi:hypothetical protein
MLQSVLGRLRAASEFEMKTVDVDDPRTGVNTLLKEAYGLMIEEDINCREELKTEKTTPEMLARTPRDILNIFRRATAQYRDQYLNEHYT